eukprot:3235969-Alexandrium_andersonii.AAC.1
MNSPTSPSCSSSSTAPNPVQPPAFSTTVARSSARRHSSSATRRQAALGTASARSVANWRSRSA